MSVKGKNNDLYKLTEAKEKETLKEIENNYQEVLNNIKKEIAKYADKGELSRTEIYKYRRAENLQRAIENELKNIEYLKQNKLYDYVYDQYGLNYYYSGYIHETEYGKPLNYQMLPKESIKASIENDFAKISLQENAVTVRTKIQKAVTQAITQGLNIDEAGELIKVALESNANNVYRIFRTETTRASNKGKLDSVEHANKYGLNLKKQWLATLDSRTRDTHQKLDGEVREQNERFSNGLMFPGDPSGEAKEVINCRCFMLTVMPGYENAREFRVERGIDGKTKEIPFTTYPEWKKARLENKEDLVVNKQISIDDISKRNKTIKELNTLPKKISKGQQRKHIKDSNEYKQYVDRLQEKGKYGPSYLTVDDIEINNLIEKYSGNGEFDYDRKGNWRNKELIKTNDKIVGYAVNQETGKEVETDVFNIHYGKRGVHIVPTYPSKKNSK